MISKTRSTHHVTLHNFSILFIMAKCTLWVITAKIFVLFLNKVDFGELDL